MKRFSRFALTAACLSTAALLLGVGAARALETFAENPLTVAEICDKLKSGSTSNDVFESLKTRHLLQKPNAADFTNLRAAGADAHLLDAMNNGTYTLDPFQANAARKRMAAGAASGAPANGGHMANQLRGKLVTMQNGGLKNYDDSKLAGKKYFAFYYSASWCGPCRKFTPQFVKYYNQIAAQHPEMEVVFVSSDQGPADMQNYMKTDNMPWPALRFERKAGEREINGYSGPGIPDLVVVDAEGKILLNSYEGKNYVGPYKIASELAKLINAPQPAFQ